MLKLFKEEVPPVAKVVDMATELDNVGPQDLPSVKSWVADLSKKVISDYSNCVSECLQDGESVSIFSEYLVRFHQYLGLLVGLSEGLLRRTKYLQYKHLTEANATPQATIKLNQGDKEQYSRGVAAGLEALTSQLSSTFNNATQRIYSLRKEL